MNFRPSWKEIEVLMNTLGIENGCSTPKDCVPTEKLAIIIPYKDREDHLVKWLYHMHQILGTVLFRVIIMVYNYCILWYDMLYSRNTLNDAMSTALDSMVDVAILKVHLQ